MEEVRNKNAGQGLGIAGFVIAIIGLIISFIPCLGLWPLLIGTIALLLSILGYIQTNKEDTKKGLIIAALIIATLSCFNAYRVYQNTKDLSGKLKTEFKKAIEDEMGNEGIENLENAMEQLEGEIEDVTDEKVEEATDTINKTVKDVSEQLEEVAEELEKNDED